MFLKKALLLLTVIYFMQHLNPIHGLSGHHLHPRHSIDTDKAALLAFKNGISSDPNSTLANWNKAFDVCNFTGITCGKLHHRVITVDLRGSSLQGLLPPVLSNLTRLKYLYLDHNSFHGPIPSELSSLRDLVDLSLSYNNFQGQVPGSLSSLSKLKMILLKTNNLSGKIPPLLFFNCTLLQNVDLSENGIGGRIPREIGNCHNLWNLNLYSTKLEGEIPLTLQNAKGLISLDVEETNISGELPSELFSKFRYIRFLHLSNSRMVSHDNNTNLEPFFTALANCGNLMELELTGLRLGGILSSSIGRLSRNLTTFQLQENNIVGEIPSEIGNLINLTLLNLTSNFLTGTIPAEIGNLIHLEQLSLSFNFFHSAIPGVLGKLTSLGLLDLSHNNLSGELPEELGNISSIRYMFLNNNLFSGKIPPSLGKCTSLLSLDLSYNKLKGEVPSQLLGLSEMRRFLNLSHNELEGQLPGVLTKLLTVEEIDLSSNNFTGNIYYYISNCYALTKLNLSSNSLNGSLPNSLGELQNLVSLDVSSNNLSGTIPTSLNKVTTLAFVNLSNNDFSGTIPSRGVFDIVNYTSFSGNPKLCGHVRGIQSCNRKLRFLKSRVFLITFPIVIFISGTIIVTICRVIGCRRMRTMISARQSRKVTKAPPDLIHNFPRITYKELSEATSGFNDQRLVGRGSYGRVYKGVLPDGTQIAVKVLQMQTGNSTKSFNRECQVFKRIRHRNLIRIITACSLPDFKAIVLPYMTNGSLESRLYPHDENGLRTGSSDLDLITRVSICSDIAEGMAYLHHHSPVKVVHCDLKPSNVLLNEDMTALVSDFGIARLVTVTTGNGGAIENTGNSTLNMMCGSIGYIAPEYGFGLNTSTKGDVYSFGVLVLEMVTRKRPTDDMFNDGLNLHKYVKNNFHRQIEDVVDPSLFRASRNLTPEMRRMWEVAIGELLELGLLCTFDSPSTRPTMLDCADDLDRLKKYLNGDTTATFASSLGISSSTYSVD